MDAQEKLSDLRALYAAVSSQRASRLRLVNSRPYRKRRLRNVIHRIRVLRIALARSVKELLDIRGSTNGAIDAELVRYDARLKELQTAILHAEQRSRIERILKIKAQMESLGMELPSELLAEAQEQGRSALEALLAVPAQAGGSDDDPDEDLILS